MSGKKVREFAVVQNPGYHEWSADYVRSEIDRRMLKGDISESEIEKLADGLGCRIVWAGPDGKVWVC